MSCELFCTRIFIIQSLIDGIFFFNMLKHLPVPMTSLHVMMEVVYQSVYIVISFSIAMMDRMNNFVVVKLYLKKV